MLHNFYGRDMNFPTMDYVAQFLRKRLELPNYGLCCTIFTEETWTSQRWTLLYNFYGRDLNFPTMDYVAQCLMKRLEILNDKFVIYSYLEI